MIVYYLIIIIILLLLMFTITENFNYFNLNLNLNVPISYNNEKCLYDQVKYNGYNYELSNDTQKTFLIIELN